MAVASPHQPQVPVQQLTPPSSSHGGRGSWDFAVPLDPAKPFYAEQEPFMSEDVVPAHPYSPREPLSVQPNGASKVSRSPIEPQGQYAGEEQGFLAPNRVAELHKKGSGDVSANGSDPDSVLEYYKGPDNRNGTTAKTKTKKKTTKAAPYWTEAERDENNWIHRDKLKEIEIREMEEAGLRIGRASRSNSRSQSARRASRDRTNSEATDPAYNSDDRQDNNRRMVSPIPAEEEETALEQVTSWDLRKSAEIMAERDQYAARNNNVVRPGTSRIPVAKTSPVPVPPTLADRDAPLPRPRKGSGNWNGDAIATNGARARSGSVSSQLLLDEPRKSEDAKRSPMAGNFSSPTSPASSSPPKAKTPGKPTPTGRKTSAAQKGQPKSRNVSSSSPIKRPGTSGGSLSRPSTSHRPEGEAPWIATMYKPDPRLPPDQQIIPTHAKRMQQEQWENEGRVGSMYDKEFRLLNTEEHEHKRASQIQPTDLEKAQEDEQWPLPSPTKGSPDRGENALVKSPTNEQNSYKLTPTIPQSPRVPSRASTNRQATAPSPKPTTTRLPEPLAEKENEKEKKSCCCIVM